MPGVCVSTCVIGVSCLELGTYIYPWYITPCYVVPWLAVECMYWRQFQKHKWARLYELRIIKCVGDILNAEYQRAHSSINWKANYLSKVKMLRTFTDERPLPPAHTHTNTITTTTATTHECHAIAPLLKSRFPMIKWLCFYQLYRVL